MDIEKLSLLLKPWLRVGTWYTGHPTDDQRFHRALKTAFDEIGVHISSDDFQQAIVSCLKDQLPGNVNAFESYIEEFAQRGENIASYLIDLKPY